MSINPCILVHIMLGWYMYCFRHLLGDPDLNMDFDQELKVLKERQEMVQRAGLNSGMSLRERG